MSFRELVGVPSVFVALCLAGLSGCHRNGADDRPPSSSEKRMHLYTLKTNTLEGEAVSLDRYAGKVSLLVNVASFCGNTPQYSELESLYKKYEGRGFVVLGFPSNDFGKQEPGTAQEIREFCSTKYHVTFPIFEKVQTKAGDGQSPIYAALKKSSGELPSWNFGKYLIGRDGEVVRFFSPKEKPDSAELVAALEKALEQPAPAAR